MNKRENFSEFRIKLDAARAKAGARLESYEEEFKELKIAGEVRNYEPDGFFDVLAYSKEVGKTWQLVIRFDSDERSTVALASCVVAVRIQALALCEELALVIQESAYRTIAEIEALARDTFRVGGKSELKIEIDELCSEAIHSITRLQQIKKANPEMRIKIDKSSWGSILNGYREGDITFTEALDLFPFAKHA